MAGSRSDDLECGACDQPAAWSVSRPTAEGVVTMPMCEEHGRLAQEYRTPDTPKQLGVVNEPAREEWMDTARKKEGIEKGEKLLQPDRHVNGRRLTARELHRDELERRGPSLGR